MFMAFCQTAFFNYDKGKEFHSILRLSAYNDNSNAPYNLAKYNESECPRMDRKVIRKDISM